MPRIGAIFSLLLALSFVAISASPAVTPAQANWDSAVGLAVAGGVTGVYLGTAFDGPGWLIGGCVGATAGFIAGWFLGGDGSGGAKEGQQQHYALDVINKTKDDIEWAHAWANGTKEVMENTYLYEARKAEYAAYNLYMEQKNAGTSHIYDAQYVLSHSEVANGSMAWLAAVMAQYNAIGAGWTSMPQNFIGDYDTMSYIVPKVYFDGVAGHENAKSTYASKPYRMTELNQLLYYGNTNKYLYLAGDYDYKLVNCIDTAFDGEISVVNGAGTITNISLSLQPWEVGTVKLSDHDLPSGRYSIVMPTHVDGSNTNPTLAMFGVASQDLANSANIYPAVLTYYKSGELALLDGIQSWPSLSSGYCIILDNENGWRGPTLRGQADWEKTGFGLATEGGQTYFASLGTGMDDLVDSMTVVKQHLVSANNYAQSYYNMLVATNGAVPGVMPDATMPDPSQMENLNWQQIYAVYIAYMNAMKGQFLNYTTMTLADVNISIDSFDLMCRGSIYDAQGNQIAGNDTIFTPFTMLNGWTIELGNNTLTQSGYVIVWGHSPTLADFLDLLAHPENYQTSASMGSMDKSMDYILISSGFNLSIEEMTYKGVPVTSHELRINTLDFYIHGATNNPQGNPWSLTDMAWLLAHWYWFAIALGVVVLIGGFWTRSWMFVATGGVIVVVGVGAWLLADWSSSGGLLSGWLDGLF